MRMIVAALAALVAAVAVPVAALAQDAGNVTLSQEAVFFDPAAPVLGNPEGDVTIVEFFDYQCPYCKKMHPDLMDVVKTDGNVRLVMKDWPIFGPASEYAARMAVAASYQDAYGKANDALMAEKGKLTDDAVDRILGDAGIDVDRARKDLKANKTAIEALLSRNDQQATAFNFPGTPGLVVERFIFWGTLDRTGLLQAISDARKAQAAKK
ncbi:Thiol:disulfide interchange protein DsbA precursor [Hartmannibacter diazotrophicus]|uniref:Thiol:disulfide interchange protein DsbA n=1 Tax=Hartmannibacter diazotrophicus TaxID=1482074 RepID=A0A2C9D4B7_9HYPH|nr:DsbA family protein [Hartmannibacter diazotrophicus]SON55029.1 Thiol:disulfide interchange protein DsbA precursor [Hartmannibacter diazotrophicus]